MAQTIISGLRDLNTAQANIIPTQVVQNRIDLLTANDAPWTLLTRAANKKKAVGDWEFRVYQDLLIKVHTTLAAQVLVAGTTWNLATGTGAYVSGWDILWNRTRNVFVHVQSMSSDAATVLANADSGTDTQGEIGDEVIVLGNATQESGNVVQAKTTQETYRTNYVTDVMTALEFSDMALNSDSFFSESDYMFQKNKAAIAHQRKLEGLMKLGPKAALLTSFGTYENPTKTSTAYPVGMTLSFRAFMNSYADSDHIITETDLTEAEFITKVLKPIFYAENEGQNKKKVVGYVPPSFLVGLTLWNIGRQRFESVTSQKPASAGLSFNRWLSPFGPIDLIVDQQLESSISGGVHYAFFVDLARVGYVPYKNLDTHFIENAVKDGRKRTLGYYRTVFGTHYTQENAHVWLKFATVSAA